MLSLPPDGSFVFQVVAFLIFWFLMKRLLFDPVQKVVEGRQDRLTGFLARAEELEGKARGLEEEVKRQVASARAEAMRESDEIRRLAEVEERAIIERARNQAAETIQQARDKVSQEADAARAELGQRAAELASAVAASIMGRPV